MMSRLRQILPVVILVCGLLAAGRTTYGNVKYNKLEKKPCVTCHTTIQGKKLNAVGKCYKDKLTLNGCAPKQSHQ